MVETSKSASPPSEFYSPGLEGVIAGETAISTIAGGLSYRGYPVGELVEHTSFDEVAYLLLYGDLPTAAELRAYRERQSAARNLPGPLRQLFAQLPGNASPMDTLRTAVSVLASFDPNIHDDSRQGKILKAERLLAQLPCAVADQYRLARRLQVVPPRGDLAHAENFLYMLTGTLPDPFVVRALDVSFILYAEHEFNASTFTARVIASTESDLHSAITGAVGALKGRLHGGANEQVMDLLRAAGGPDTAEAWIKQALARKEKIMGFGHRVYKTGDVRAGILSQFARQAAERAGDLRWEETAAIIEKVMAEQKNLFPNLDWPAGRLYHALGLEVSLYTPLFVLARVAGWSAHVIEQAEHNRIIRPRGRYIGPEIRKVRPLAERG